MVSALCVITAAVGLIPSQPRTILSQIREHFNLNPQKRDKNIKGIKMKFK